MSGIYGQFGMVKEVGAAATITGITAVAGAPNTGTVAATAHGYRAGDVITLTGFTPAGWNQTYTIMSVPTTNSFVISTGSTVVATSTVQGTVSTVTKFGGGGTPTRFFGLVSETVKGDFRRVVSNATTAGRLTRRADGFATYPAGAGGDVMLEVTSKGFAYWLSLLLGSVVQSGPTDTAAYTYTATQGPLLGQSCNLQFGRPLSLSNVVQPFTYPGSKVESWSFDCAVDGILILKITFACQKELITVALATASYPSGVNELFTFIGGSLTLATVPVATVKTLSISCSNALTGVADRRFMNAGGTPQEMITNGWRDIQWKAGVEFVDMVAYNRYASSTAAGSMAALVASFTAPSVITGASSTVPSLTFTLPNARHDGDTPNIAGPAQLLQALGGPALNTNATADDAITAVLVSADSTA
jgi:hypothetical protein